MVEEADAGVELRGRGRVEINRDGNLGLISITDNGGAPWPGSNYPGNFRPAEGLPVVAEAAHAEVLRQLHVRLAVADDGG